jgi:IS30 family transposase
VLPYTHLDLQERCRLRGLTEKGLGIGEITWRLERDRVMIHRGIEREHCVEGSRPDSTQRRA